MKKEKNPIDELFKNGLENKEMNPSPNAWEKIEEAMASEDEKRGGFYFMRAAVVTLLIGLSTWVYMTNNIDSITDITPTEETVGLSSNIENMLDGPDKEEQTQTSQKEDPKKEKTKPNKTKTNIKKKGGKSPIVPLVPNQKGPSTILVSNDLPVVDEGTLSGNEPLMQVEELKVKEEPKSFKIKYRVPVTQKSFYADKGTNTEEETIEKPKLKDRVFAYANTQIGNLLNGKPVELPETPKPGKPQLEITFDKLFNN